VVVNLADLSRRLNPSGRDNCLVPQIGEIRDDRYGVESFPRITFAVIIIIMTLT